MTTLKQIKPLLDFIKKNHRPILTKVRATNETLSVTDLETTIIFHDNYGLDVGLHDVNTLGLIPGNTKDFQDFPLIDTSTENFIDKVFLNQETIEAIIPFTSKDETRPYLNGMAINDGHFVATDGHTLRAIKMTGKLNENYIIPATSLKILLKLIKKFKVKNELLCFLDNGYLITEAADFSFKCRLIQREYPKWQNITPSKFQNTLKIDNWIDFKELKPLFNTRNFACILTNIENSIILKIKGHVNQYIIGKTDLNFEVGFNVTFIEKAIEKKTSFNIEYNGPLSPTLINGAIIMPLKV